MGNETGKKTASIGGKIAKYLVILLALALGLFVALAVLKVLFLYSVYYFFFEKTAGILGLDAIFSRLLAVLATGLLLLSLPTIASFVFLGKKRKEVLIGSAVALTAFSCLLYFGSENVFFDRSASEVRATQYYVKTMNGFKFSSAPDIDPQFGIRYQPVTPEIVKEILAWRKLGTYEKMPVVQPGKYFDMLSGNPIAWYIERGNEIVLFPLPGFDPQTGERLKPMTSESSKRYDKQVQAKLEAAIAREKQAQAETALAKEQRTQKAVETERIRERQSLDEDEKRWSERGYTLSEPFEIPPGKHLLAPGVMYSSRDNNGVVRTLHRNAVAIDDCTKSEITPYEIYRWESDDGVMHFSNERPKGNIGYVIIKPNLRDCSGTSQSQRMRE